MRPARCIDIAHLHQFAAVDGTVAGHIEVIVGKSHQPQSLAQRSVDIHSLHTAQHQGGPHLTSDERVDGCEHNTLPRDSLNGIEWAAIAAYVVQDGHMVDSQTVDTLRDLSDGVGARLRHKEQVTVMNFK